MSRRYSVGGLYQYTSEEVYLRLLGDRGGFGREQDLLLLNDELVSAIGVLLFETVGNKYCKVLSTYQLCSLFQIADGVPPTFPKQSTLACWFDCDDLAGVMYVPLHHWVFVRIYRIRTTWHIEFYDSLGADNELCTLRQRAEHMVRQLGQARHTCFDYEYVYRWPMPRQRNCYDCGIIALSWLEMVLEERNQLSDRDIGSLNRTSLQRAKYARMLLELGTLQDELAVRSAPLADESSDVVVLSVSPPPAVKSAQAPSVLRLPHAQQRQLHGKAPDTATIVELVESSAPSHDDIMREAVHHNFLHLEDDHTFLDAMKGSDKWIVQVITDSVIDARYWSSKPKSMLLIGKRHGRYRLLLEYNIITGLLYVPHAEAVLWNNVHVQVPSHTSTVYVGNPPPQQEIQVILLPEQRMLRIKNLY